MNIVLQISITAIMSKLEQVKVHIYVRTCMQDPCSNIESDLEIQTIVRPFWQCSCITAVVLSSQHWYLYIQSYLQEAQALHQQMKERLSEVHTYAALTAVLCSLVGGLKHLYFK